MTENDRALLLTASYQPIDVITWQRALALLTRAKVDILEEYDEEIRGGSMVIRVPSVLRLRRMFYRGPAPVKFSRANIYARDHHRCQYCGVHCAANELTYDHVVPRSRGGSTRWTNIVSCCYACNARKANRTPAEAKMRLRKQPIQPTWAPEVQIRVSTTSIPDAWRDYMYWTGEIDGDDGTTEVA